MTLLVAALALGCTTEPEKTPHLPRFTEISSTADGYVGLIDRVEVLEDAREESTGGAPVDIATANELFRVNIDSNAIQALDDALDTTVDEYENIALATSAAGTVDLTLQNRLGSMNQALLSMDSIEPNEITEYHWSSSRSVTNDLGETVTVEFNQHWVGTGWLLDMRMTSQDGKYDDTLWFNGYYQADGTLGWWDFYRTGGILVVFEWIGDKSTGEAQLLWPTGDDAGDAMTYAWAGSGPGMVQFLDSQPPPNPDLETSVTVESDLSGQALIPDYAETDVVCWDSNLENTDCPGETDTGGDTGGGDTGGGDTGS